MSDADLLAGLVLLLCLGGSMFFSGSETAITTFGEHQWRKLVEGGGRDGRIARDWVESPVRVLSTILVGNNLVNTLMGAVTTATAIRHLGGGALAEYSVAISVFFAASLVIVFGEILPKAAGRMYASRVAVPALSILHYVGNALAPITALTALMTNALLRRTDSDASAQRVTSEDLDYLVKVGQREGSIPADQAALLRRIFQFEDKIVRDIMVPRDRVTAIDLAWSVERIIDVAHASGHSRMPAFEGDLDRIKGVLHIKQLVGSPERTPEAVTRLTRTPLFVSESLMISDLLERFKERRVHLAIVVDDGGHTVGVVTLEDVLEQIVGHIFDESDHAPQQAHDGLGIHYFDGQTSLRKLEDAFSVEFEEVEGVSSVGDLLTQLAGQMPMAGSLFVVEGLRMKVLAADDRRVLRLSVEQVAIDDDDDD